MIRGRKIELSKVKKVEGNFEASIHNRFDVEVIDAKTGKVKQRAVGHNVICNALWTRMASNSAYFTHIHYGTGNGTPSAADTSLFAFKGYVQISSDQGLKIDDENCVASITCKVQLGETVAVGAVLTEVGIAYGTSASNLVTHAMLKDMNGNNISLEKTDTDIVNIYATVFVHWPAEYSDPNNGIQIIGTMTNYSDHNYNKTYSFFHYLLGRSGFASYLYLQLVPRRFTHYGGVSYGKTQEEYIGGATLSFDASTRKATLSFRFGANYANSLGGQHGVMLYTHLENNSAYSTGGPTIYLKAGKSWFPYSEIADESVGTGDGATVDFATKFDLPYDATVYVDGVAVPDAIVENVPIRYDKMFRYFNQIIVKKGKIYPSGCYLVNNTNGFDIIGVGIYENPFHEFGIKGYKTTYSSGYSGKVRVSDDAVNWSEPFTMSGSAEAGIDFPEDFRYKRYWKFDSSPENILATGQHFAVDLTGKNIHFQTPPAAGSVITIDYKTPTIAKDENHVFDINLTIQLGEYTEAQ